MRSGIWEIIIIAVLVVLLFGGARKIPEMMRNLASGVRTFKEEIKEKPAKKMAPKKTAKKKK